MKKTKIGLFSLVGIGIFMIASLSRIFGDAKNSKQNSEGNQQKYFAIVPHFTIQPTTIEKFYAFLQTSYAIKKNEAINIVLISPDHFASSKYPVDMLCENSKSFCFGTTCLAAKALPASKTSGCLDTRTTREHGLGAQFLFIKQQFPHAKIFPIVLKPRKFIDNAQIIQMLSTYPFEGKTLFLASVDFSHYTDEDFAQLHDTKSFYTLNNAKDIGEYGSLEVDCPSCLYITNTLAQQNNQYPHLFLRDSSSTIMKKNLGTGNTSRAFISYSSQHDAINGITLAFFGDTIYDRQVSALLPIQQLLAKHFKTFYQNEDSQLSLANAPHRKLFGIDVVGLNLETPVVNSPKTCQKSNKEVRFCSSSLILPYLKSIGFSLVNVANNHSFDGGTLAHEETIQQIKNNGLNYIGYVRNGPYFEKNYTRKTKIRGISVAFQGYDFTITAKSLFSGYCADLKKNTSDGYKNIVSVHRGLEYQTTHNALQESLGKQLIDCGADIIIGHHPHVIQDIQRYKGKPIIYSLGNFLFDQYFSEATKTGMYALITIPLSGSIVLQTGSFNAVP